MKPLKRILIVDDNLSDIELSLEALELHHLANRVDVARDGEEALDYLNCRGKYKSRANDFPIVVFLDLKMPKVDGLEVLREIKSDENLKVIPVVIVTSSREEQDLIQSYNLGVNAYVVKPVDFEQFTKAIEELGLFWAVINEVPTNELINDTEKGEFHEIKTSYPVSGR